MSDIILFWNEVALEANRISFTNGKGEQQGPTLSSRALAIVHVAMYDSYAAFIPATGTPYLTGLTPPSTPPAEALAAARAAVGAAAYTTLLALYPSQKAFFDLKLPLASDVLNIGHAFGIIVAEKILDLRKKIQVQVQEITNLPAIEVNIKKILIIRVRVFMLQLMVHCLILLYQQGINLQRLR